MKSRESIDTAFFTLWKKIAEAPHKIKLHENLGKFLKNLDKGTPPFTKGQKTTLARELEKLSDLPDHKLIIEIIRGNDINALNQLKESLDEYGGADNFINQLNRQFEEKEKKDSAPQARIEVKAAPASQASVVFAALPAELLKLSSLLNEFLNDINKLQLLIEEINKKRALSKNPSSVNDAFLAINKNLELILDKINASDLPAKNKDFLKLKLFMQQSRCYYLVGNIENAIGLLEKAKEIIDTDHETYLELSYLDPQYDDVKKASPAYMIYHNLFALYTEKANAQLKQEGFENSKKEFEKAIAAKIQLCVIKLSVASSAEKYSIADEALEYLAKVINHFEQFKSSLSYFSKIKGEIELQNGQYQNALASYVNALCAQQEVSLQKPIEEQINLCVLELTAQCDDPSKSDNARYNIAKAAYEALTKLPFANSTRANCLPPFLETMAEIEMKHNQCYQAQLNYQQASYWYKRSLRTRVEQKAEDKSISQADFQQEMAIRKLLQSKIEYCTGKVNEAKTKNNIKENVNPSVEAQEHIEKQINVRKQQINKQTHIAPSDQSLLESPSHELGKEYKKRSSRGL